MALVRANPKWSVPGHSGAIASGWKVYTYIAGTTTPKDTYSDYTEGSANANPVILDSRGEADIWFSGIYKIVVKDTDDVTIWTVDSYGEGEAAVQVGNYNLVQNGSFETATAGEPDEWAITDYINGSHTIDASDQYHGLNSLKFTSAGQGGGYATSAYFEVQEAQVTSVDWLMKSSAADVRNVVDIIWYTAAKTAISTTNIYDDSTTNPTSWAQKSGDGSAPSTARYAQIRAYGCHSSDVTSGITRFDNFKASAPVVGAVFEFGTLMLFQQTTAPTGWTKQTTHNDKALRVISGSASSGGSKAFTTTFGAGKATDAHQLTITEMPTHTHSTGSSFSGSGAIGPFSGSDAYSNTTGSTGGDGTHTHNLSNFDLQYVDLIIASKD